MNRCQILTTLFYTHPESHLQPIVDWEMEWKLKSSDIHKGNKSIQVAGRVGGGGGWTLDMASPQLFFFS